MSQPSWIGHTIGGRYKIEALLGQGGMSAVYKATDPNLRRAVAIKLIHPHLSSDPEFVRRFEQEAAAVAQLRHPNIIQVFDFNHDGDVYYMVLEFVAGETLQARLKALNAANQRLPQAAAVWIMALVCDAVAYAHQHGMIHRDLKPANVMLDPRGQPILTDFGVAKILGGQQHTATGAIIGTVAYMSPEQVRGERVDTRGDIYALGIMLYEMTAGRPPFEADSAMTLMMKHLNEPAPDIRKIVGGLPESLAAVIEKALAKDPADRFQSAAEMAAALRAIGAEVRARPAGVSAVPPAAQPEPAARTLASPPPAAPTEAPRAPLTPAVQPKAAQPVAPAIVTPTPAPPPAAAATMTSPTAPPMTPPTVAKVPEAELAPHARKRGAPLGLFLGLGAIGLVAIAIAWFVLPKSGFRGLATGEIKSTPTPGVATISEASPTLASVSATVTPLPPTVAPSPTSPPPTSVPTLKPAATVEPTATPIPLPEGMVLVPGGDFNMGSEAGGLDERPVHAVTLDAFFLDQHEVTNSRYQKCVEAGVCTPPAIKGSQTRTSYFDNSQYANYPVIKVTWNQAEAFCAWDQGKRLPTEAEWEYAASGGDGRRYPWGNDFNPDFLPVKENDTTQVGSHPGNVSPFGVYDMAGNVLEWVADRYGRAYYARSPNTNPAGPETGVQRVLRGGSYGNPDSPFYTTTRRYQQGPGFHDVDIGFRCARHAP